MSEDNIERQMHSDMYKHYPPSLKIISNNTYKMNPENKPIGEKIQKNILNKPVNDILIDNNKIRSKY